MNFGTRQEWVSLIIVIAVILMAVGFGVGLLIGWLI